MSAAYEGARGLKLWSFLGSIAERRDVPEVILMLNEKYACRQSAEPATTVGSMLMRRLGNNVVACS